MSLCVPIRRMWEEWKTSTHSWPRHWIGVSGQCLTTQQLHPLSNSWRHPSNTRLGVFQLVSPIFGTYKSHTTVGNRTAIPQESSPWRVHYNDWTMSATEDSSRHAECHICLIVVFPCTLNNHTVNSPTKCTNFIIVKSTKLQYCTFSSF
jgi:hypothetical protein